MHLQKRREKTVMFIVVLAIAALFALFLKDIMVPFIRLQLSNDLDGATALLRDKGIQGFLSVALIEALQMVVVFIPAEFIQISSGLSYPFPIALLLCDLGVGLGATIIFVLVRFFHVSNSAYEKRRRNIDRISSGVHDRNTVFLLYLLFFMPLIPFGAICYFGSGSKLSYRKYILSVMSGVIPSIVVSNLMGAAGTAFLKNSIPLWLLILIIVVLAALLFALILFFLNRFCLKGTKGTPDSFIYSLTLLLARLWQGRPRHLEIDDTLLQDLEAPYVLLANHESFSDFNYVSRLQHPRNPSYMVNEFYCTRPFLRTLAKGGGFIPKKLFTADISSALAVLRMIRKGYPVVIFPEGRLSLDGSTNPIQEGARFYRKLGADLVLLGIDGAYFAHPKWRKKAYKSKVRLKVERIIRKEDIVSMTDQEIEKAISDTLCRDESDNPIDRYKQKDKAVGLENVLYRCADCGELYTTKGVGNSLVCTNCGSTHTLDESYRFSGKEGIRTISQYYNAIRQMERRELGSFKLVAKVKTKIFGKNGGPSHSEYGECSLDSSGFGYHSDSTDFKIPIAELPALAFSCNQEFELYHDGRLHYFYPEQQSRQVARWALFVDLLAERRCERNAEHERKENVN